MSNEILHSKIQRSLHDLREIEKGNVVFEIPEYISENLNHPLRPYQEDAMRHFIYTQNSDAANIAYNHLLFHMATGSGKTIVLASTILFLYKEKNYRNFIFFVNSDAIIKKTFDNLTNIVSSKYLFNPEGIVIDGKHTMIQVVDVFPTICADNTIYLKLTTIQKLHADLNYPKENGLTYETIQDQKIVLLADEAHHINAITRGDKKKLNTKELEEKTWENTISSLLKANIANRLIEYTATIDLNNDALFNKYKDKIVYQYDLKRFMDDGYSKNVVLLRANEDDQQKMLNGILLSQYRKYIARDNEITLKPIILFKSNTISTSMNANATFLNLVNNLNENQLAKVIENGLAVFQNENSIYHKMFLYYKEKKISKIVEDIKWDFVEETILNANESSFISDNNALLLNTLEDDNNPIRVIFAVAKLNEGWDVLNLFDIVRISEGATFTKTTTDSEAQLIGRGARYYPFVENRKKSYIRRYDYKNADLKVIETLHYHTINDNSYIKNLERSLETANIQIKEDKYIRLEAKLKANFRNLDIYQNGKVYINKLIPTKAEDYRSFKDYNVSSDYDIRYETLIEQDYGTQQLISSTVKRHEEQLIIPKALFYKAIQRNPFYSFSNLKNYIPNLSSIKEFVDNPLFLGGVSINLSLPKEISFEDLSAKEKLIIVERFLTYAERNIKSNYMKERGTSIFEGIAISEVVEDYLIEMNKSISKTLTFSQVIKSRNMKDHEWYVYDKAIVNGLESDLIDFIIDYMDQLKSKYDEVYLIRNERKIKVFEIGGVRGFMPDFLLYLKSEGYAYQVFIEPKGKHLREVDSWKEDFLISLANNPDVEILDENESMKLIGLKFYSTDSGFKQDFRQNFIDQLIEEN